MMGYGERQRWHKQTVQMARRARINEYDSAVRRMNQEQRAREINRQRYEALYLKHLAQKKGAAAG